MSENEEGRKRWCANCGTLVAILAPGSRVLVGVEMTCPRCQEYTKNGIKEANTVDYLKKFFGMKD